MLKNLKNLEQVAAEKEKEKIHVLEPLPTACVWSSRQRT